MADGVTPTDGEAAAALPVRWWANLSTRGKAFAVGLGAVVTALGTFFGVIDGGLDLWDRLFPPPTPIVAKIEPKPVVEPDVTWSVFVEEHARVESPPEADLEAIGGVFRVGLTADGLGGKTVTLRWVQRNQDGARIATPAWVPRELSVELREGSQTIQEVWVPLPSEEERFFVDYTLVDPNGEPRATAQSAVVRVGH